MYFLFLTDVDCTPQNQSCLINDQQLVPFTRYISNSTLYFLLTFAISVFPFVVLSKQNTPFSKFSMPNKRARQPSNLKSVQICCLNRAKHKGTQLVRKMLRYYICYESAKGPFKYCGFFRPTHLHQHKQYCKSAKIAIF